MRAPLPYFASLPSTTTSNLSNKHEIGEYYLVTNNANDTRLIKILSITPGNHYYVEMDGVRKWLKDIGSYDKLSYYVIEHLEKEYVNKLFREQKLERILKDIYVLGSHDWEILKEYNGQTTRIGLLKPISDLIEQEYQKEITRIYREKKLERILYERKEIR